MEERKTTPGSFQVRRGSELGALLGCLLLLASVRLPAQSGQVPLSQPQPSHSILRPEANRLPDANDIMEMRESKVSRSKFKAANLERKRQIDEDTMRLVKLAGEVKVEMDMDPGNARSPLVVSKLEEISRLAHGIEVKMKLAIIPAE